MPRPPPFRFLPLALAVGLSTSFADDALQDRVRRVELVVQGGHLASGPRLVKLVRDEVVELTVVSDRPDELHVHGYDLRATLKPGTPATLRFTARRTGRFGFELHGSGSDLGVLEIYPK